jgi:hypothetical protein
LAVINSKFIDGFFVLFGKIKEFLLLFQIFMLMFSQKIFAIPYWIFVRMGFLAGFCHGFLSGVFCWIFGHST